MPTQVQFRRGSGSQNNSFTGGAGEVTVNTDNNALRVHNGSTSGGFELARADLSNVSGIGSVSISGISTVGSLSIGSTEVISGARQLKNITSLDATTTATIESAVSAAPNDFTSLNISGIGTIAVGTVTNLTGTAATITTLRSTTINADTGNIVTGVTTNFTSTNGTVTNLTGTAGTITTLRSTTGNFTTGNIVTGVTTNFTSTNGSVTNLTGTAATITTLNSTILTVSGISTFAQSVAFVGIVTFYNNIDLQDNDKIVLGDGNDFEIFHDGSSSRIVDNGGGGLELVGDPNVTIFHSAAGISTFGSAAVNIAGGTHIGVAGITTIPEIKVGAAVTAGSYGINIAGGTHIGVAGITTVQQIKVGAAMTASDSGIQFSGGTAIGVAAGIITAPNGFSSGIGTAVKITVSGNTITFTVGAGTTTLTLQ